MKRTGNLVCGLIAGEIYILFKDVLVLPVARVVVVSVLYKCPHSFFDILSLKILYG